MTDARAPDPEELIRVQVERAVAPYLGHAPPFMIAKLRELAERYWREHPTAVRIIHMMASSGRVRSGNQATALGEPDVEAPARTKEK